MGLYKTCWSVTLRASGTLTGRWLVVGTEEYIILTKEKECLTSNTYVYTIISSVYYAILLFLTCLSIVVSICVHVLS